MNALRRSQLSDLGSQCFYFCYQRERNSLRRNGLKNVLGSVSAKKVTKNGTFGKF
jgi:hypothetical protein